jgi:hypothetical protein
MHISAPVTTEHPNSAPRETKLRNAKLNYVTGRADHDSSAKTLDQTLFRNLERSGVALETAVRMPLRIRRGLGGHPGTATSTGMTLDTRPQLA